MIRLWLKLGLFAVVFAAGWQIENWRMSEKISKVQHGHAHAIHIIAAEAARLRQETVEKARLIERQNLENAAFAAQMAAAADREERVVERVIRKQEIVYVQSDNARDCGISAAGVQLHDAAARGASSPDGVPEADPTSSLPDDSPIAVRNAELMSTVVRNYKSCRDAYTRLQGLQKFILGQQG